MTKLSRDDVLKLARLSRLKLTDVEIDLFAKELSAILDYVEILDQAEVAGLAPTYQVTGLKNVTRPDRVIKYQAAPQSLLANAPAVEDGHFKVKRVLG